jgi:hypothetical protein
VHFRENSELLRGKGQSIAGGEGEQGEQHVEPKKVRFMLFYAVYTRLLTPQVGVDRVLRVSNAPAPLNALERGPRADQACGHALALADHAANRLGVAAAAQQRSNEPPEPPSKQAQRSVEHGVVDLYQKVRRRP